MEGVQEVRHGAEGEQMGLWQLVQHQQRQVWERQRAQARGWEQRHRQDRQEGVGGALQWVAQAMLVYPWMALMRPVLWLLAVVLVYRAVVPLGEAAVLTALWRQPLLGQGLAQAQVQVQVRAMDPVSQPWPVQERWWEWRRQQVCHVVEHHEVAGEHSVQLAQQRQQPERGRLAEQTWHPQSQQS